MRTRERFWGENARPFFIQAMVGISVALFMVYVVMPAGLGRAIEIGVCRYLTGTC
jgi:hypothetical protein